MAATPHVRDDYPTTAAQMEAGVAELRTALAEAGVQLDVLPGGELAVDRLATLAPGELRRFGLGGNPGYVLVEVPYVGWPLALAHEVGRLRRDGLTPVLAHPERNPEVQHDPERLRPLVEAGALVQVTAASVDGRLGRRARAAGLDLVERGLAQMLASDAHAPGVREVGLSAAARAVADDALARWLTQEVPGAIVTGSPVPARPPSSSRSRFRHGAR